MIYLFIEKCYLYTHTDDNFPFDVSLSSNEVNLTFPHLKENLSSAKSRVATDMAKDGLSDRKIATAGRWSSDASKQFIRPSSISIP